MPLGQKWQRIQVGKKTFLAANEVRQHTPRRARLFLFQGRMRVLNYSFCSQYVPIMSSSSQ